MRREQGACRAELAAISHDGRPVSVVGAVAWSLAAIAYGNGVVVAGRRLGHDQWITLIAVPLFGLAGWWWLRSRGFGGRALGVQLPRSDQSPFAGLTVAAAVFAGICAVAGFATFGQEMRGLRTLRTMVGTAFGEELIHRGVLLAVWASTGVTAGRVLLANMVTFGAWHVTGATCEGFHPGQVLWPTVGAVLFVWLRLRFRSVLAPMAVHALNVFGVLRPLKAPCPYPFG